MPTIDRIIAVRIAGALAVAVCALAVTGCSRFAWEGRWIADRGIKAAPGQDPVVAHTLGTVDLTIHGNGTFDLLNFDVPTSGTVAYGSGKAYLRTLAVYQRPIGTAGQAAGRHSKEIELTPRDDGTVEFRDPSAPDPAPVVLKRRMQPPGKSTRTN